MKTGQINEFIHKYNLGSLRDVALFVLIIVIFHVLWKTFAAEIMAIDFVKRSASFLSYHVFLQSSWFLTEVLNLDVTSFNQTIYTANNGYVKVNMSCSGFKQFYQLFFLMLLFPGPWKHKLWFIPLGLVIIHITNLIRIIGMVLVTIYIPEHWDFSHDYVFRPFFYVVMFLLWVWWVEKFTSRSLSNAPADKEPAGQKG